MAKKEIRFVGIDDSPYTKGDKSSLLIATFFRGGLALDGVMSCSAAVDGDDATERMAGMILKSKFRRQVQCIFLDGIAVAGFNVVDVQELHRKTGMPVIVVMRRYPDLEGMRRALVKMGQERKFEVIQKAGPITRINSICIQSFGLSPGEAKEFLDIACTRSFLPEPIRVAHLIAAGVVKGESRGRA
ncbi:TPA: DUF99 family protein [Candidatus Woesearchaeota archaeon]|nr:DUF99 family protein [Candidatus Woesearchaeota archaeon]HII64820.1 DUF99 family protein [Candidatus Woesearchaeota archaeon]HIJ18289.1 DUF99 family protein [Candidatus Woesearchaeota archaeon]